MRLDNRARLSLGEVTAALLTYGMEGFLDSQDGSSWATADGERDGERDGVPDADATTFAGFVQGEIEFETGIGKVLVVPGLRFDHFDNDADGYSSTTASELSPKLGVTYEPTDWLMVFASYAHAFSAPTFDELYADGTQFVIGPIVNSFVASPNLDPQTSDTIEIGAGRL